MQALIIREPRQYNADIAYPSEVRISSDRHTAIKVPGEGTCYHLYHSLAMDNTGKHDISIDFNETAQAALFELMLISLCFASAHVKAATVNFNYIMSPRRTPTC